MICRLCLCELIDEFVSIFNEFECHTESEIAKLIAKYFHIELQLDDVVSNKICNSCLKHLSDFHDFWLLVEGKQQTLLKELSNFKCNLIVDELPEVPFSEQEKDMKSVPLYEPSVDTALPERISVETNKLESLNENEATENDASPDEDFYPSNTESTASSDTETKGPPNKLKMKSKKKLTRNLQSKFTKKTDNNAKFQCKECNKVLADNNSLRNHMYRRHVSKEDLKFECNMCEKKFAKKYVLDCHLVTHRKPENLITCELCQKGFSTKRSYKAHRKTDHAEELKIICDSCGKRFKNKVGYDLHYKYAHTDLKEHEVQCQICSLWLKNVRSLGRHTMYNHRDESSGKGFVCNICGIIKYTKEKLTAHKNYHHPIKMHKCTLCNKEFKRLLALEEHMAVHTGQPLYTCQYCPQTFKSNGNMHSHRRRLHRNEVVRKNPQPHV